jgi:hypothetical protein
MKQQSSLLDFAGTKRSNKNKVMYILK